MRPVFTKPVYAVKEVTVHASVQQLLPMSEHATSTESLSSGVEKDFVVRAEKEKKNVLAYVRL